MPKRNDVNKVMVIGSGPIIIGQAAEFDYAGTQACRALKEEGLEVVLVNSNPATIMTDVHMLTASMSNRSMWNFLKASSKGTAGFLACYLRRPDWP